MARLAIHKPSRKPRWTLNVGAALLLEYCSLACAATCFVVLVSRRLSDHADWHLGVSRPALTAQPSQYPATATEAAPFSYTLEHEEPAGLPHGCGQLRARSKRTRACNG